MSIAIICKTTTLTAKDVIDQVDEIILCAAKHNGKVFGGYVRDVIVPMKFHKCTTLGVDFNDLDFWFTKQEDADNFVKEMELLSSDDFNQTGGTERYPFKVQHHKFNINNSYICVDVVVSDFYPVCDFSVNLLSWDGKDLNVNKGFDVLHLLTEGELITIDNNYKLGDIATQIRNKQCTMFIQYLALSKNQSGKLGPFAHMANLRIDKMQNQWKLN